MNPSDFRTQFFKLVDNAQNILISSHKNPDPDSFASVLSMITLLKEKYNDKNILGKYTGGVGGNWMNMKNGEFISGVDDVAAELDNFDLLIVLDAHPYDRVVNDIEKFAQFKGKKICIDHHSLSAEVKYDLFFNDPKASSVAELIYRIFLENEGYINPLLCESVLMGILGDTGWLTINMKAETMYVFDIVKRLVTLGNVNLELLRYNTFIYDKEVFPALQEIVKNAQMIKIGDWPEMVVGFISREGIKERNITELNIKSASNNFVSAYPKMFSGIMFGMSAYPLENGGVSISLRSLAGSVNVRSLADKFGGGGHEGASSIKFFPKNGEMYNPEGCLEMVFEWMRDNGPIMRD